MPDARFPHLHLIEKARGPARLGGGGGTNPAVVRNKAKRREHADYLKGKFNRYFELARERRDARMRERLPEIRGGVPFLIQIPDEADDVMEFLAEQLGLELVAEYEEGFLIVSAGRLDLENVIELANDFIEEQRGSGRMASILDVDEDPLSERRIERILSSELHERWPFPDGTELILDVSIEVAPSGAPVIPREISSEEYEAAKRSYFEEWDTERMRREDELERFIAHYEGAILSITDDSHVVDFPDSFSMRIRMRGAGFTDLIKNYPNLFEVVPPDEFAGFTSSEIEKADLGEAFRLMPPPEGGPTICVIDSGIQEGHRWLEPAIRPDESLCFIPGEEPDDVADYVRPGGHGTRVAGACLYPQSVPMSGEHSAPFWLLNARVLDEDCRLRQTIFPPDLLGVVVRHYFQSRGTRIYQHSITSDGPCRTERMSHWAAKIDQLSHRDDVLFLQCAGNLNTNGSSTLPGIVDHLEAGRDYPDYLYQPSSRIANPAQSLQALTVGSVSQEYFHQGDRRSMSPSGHPSSFTRSGFGMWQSIKPEVVEFGGDGVRDSGNPPALSTPPEVCPELVRSTRNGGPPVARDAVGTSFSTPKVAHIAGQLQALFPHRETLLYRALIVNSARWPEWAEGTASQDRPAVFRTIGYGVPDLTRATENSPYRVTLVTNQLHTIKAGEGFIFGVPIPHELRRPGDDFRVRIDVTLSYSAEPRRTRKSRRGYLAVWLDWKASKRNESFDAFRARALKEEDEGDARNDGNFLWTLGNKRDRDGTTDGVSRSRGTLQKDWAYAQSYELPDTFGVVVRGHKGWDRRNEAAEASFSLVVSFEAMRGDVHVYEQIEAAIETEVEAEQTVRVQTNL